jgi:hypothetical protein
MGMKCDELEKFDAASNADLSAGYDHRYAYEADEVDAAIAELKEKLEDAKASAYAESVDAGMENRRLKRALWLARAARARSMKTCEELDNYTRNHLNRNSRWNYISSQRYDCWFYAWDECEQKCLKKAKEYR